MRKAVIVGLGATAVTVLAFAGVASAGSDGKRQPNPAGVVVLDDKVSPAPSATDPGHPGDSYHNDGDDDDTSDGRGMDDGSGDDHGGAGNRDGDDGPGHE